MLKRTELLITPSTHQKVTKKISRTLYHTLCQPQTVCTRLGVRLLRIHRGIEFHQSYWLKKYISLSTEKRKQASKKCAFEKDFFKLLNNSIFGKTMENVRGGCTSMELVRIQKKKTEDIFHLHMVNRLNNIFHTVYPLLYENKV